MKNQLIRKWMRSIVPGTMSRNVDTWEVVVLGLNRQEDYLLIDCTCTKLHKYLCYVSYFPLLCQTFYVVTIDLVPRANPEIL